MHHKQEIEDEDLVLRLDKGPGQAKNPSEIDGIT
jgi:hypothetical protein